MIAHTRLTLFFYIASDWIWKRADDLQRHERIDIYEDQLISHILVKQGFLPVDYSGVSPFAVKGVTKEMADDACVLASDEKVGAEVGGRLRAMRKFRFESGANLYETSSGWNPSTMDGTCVTAFPNPGTQHCFTSNAPFDCCPHISRHARC